MLHPPSPSLPHSTLLPFCVFPSRCCFPFALVCVYSVPTFCLAVPFTEQSLRFPAPAVLSCCSRQSFAWKVSRSLPESLRGQLSDLVEWKLPPVCVFVQVHVRTCMCATVVLHTFVAKRLLNNIIKWLLPLSSRCSNVCVHFFCLFGGFFWPKM